jgi:hypothetical protein
MPDDPQGLACPECEAPLAFTFVDTSGVGAWKLGDGFNTTPDTAHYVCFSCAAAWKRRLEGPLTPDVVGDLAFFTCRRDACGGRLTIAGNASDPADVELACPRGHRHRVQAVEGGGLVLGEG